MIFLTLKCDFDPASDKNKSATIIFNLFFRIFVSEKRRAWHPNQAKMIKQVWIINKFWSWTCCVLYRYITRRKNSTGNEQAKALKIFSLVITMVFSVFSLSNLALAENRWSKMLNDTRIKRNWLFRLNETVKLKKYHESHLCLADDRMDSLQNDFFIFVLL